MGSGSLGGDWLQSLVRRMLSTSVYPSTICRIVADGNLYLQRETLLLPYLRGLSSFRDSVRRLAISGASPQELLALSDQFRDFDCVDLGIALDDQEGSLPILRLEAVSLTIATVDGKALVKLVSPETLRVARDEKAAAILAKANRKAENAAEEERKRQQKLEQGRQRPQDMYLASTELYSAWDANGLPTKDVEGVDLPKSKSKKLLKEWQRQEQLHEGYLAEQSRLEGENSKKE